MIYLKHYWVRDGQYLTEPGQNGPLQAHPNIPGLEVRYWLTDGNGVDYCLSTVPDDTLVTEVTPGLEILTKADWDSIVATIPEPEPEPMSTIEVPAEPNWDSFESVVLQSKEMKSFIDVAASQNSLVAAAFPAAFFEAKNGKYNSFKIVWTELIKLSPVNLEVLSGITAIANSCKLPKEFIDILEG